jgi:hypothetical protein
MENFIRAKENVLMLWEENKNIFATGIFVLKIFF